MDCRLIKKAELHCHLDGSLSFDTAKRLLAEEGISYADDELKSKLTILGDCDSLAEYLMRFDLPLSIMQTEKALEECAYNLIKQASEDGVCYIEVRYAPSLHTQKGLTYSQIVAAVIKGLQKGKEEYGVEYGLIACAMRHLPDEENINMLKGVREHLGAGLVACDLAGGEVGNPTHKYEAVFNEAKRLGMPFTIHAGEQGDVKNVLEAIDLGASRIGHGLAIAKDESAMEIVLSKDIMLELCPTSNLQTKAVSSVNEYPILEFLQRGIKLSINTDNRMVSGISLSKEFDFMQKEFKLTERDFKEIYRSSIEKSFANDDIKEKLLRND
mgnify:CR=1 FL=1